MQKKFNQGFTLIELIIVIAIIAILAAMIFVAIDPARRLHESRNTRRSSDITTILEAIKKYQTDNQGTHFSSIAGALSNTHYVIGDGSLCNGNCGAYSVESPCLNLSGLPNNYLSIIPKDPMSGTDDNTDYYLLKGLENEITIGACDTEGTGSGGTGDEPIIELTR